MKKLVFFSLLYFAVYPLVAQNLPDSPDRGTYYETISIPYGYGEVLDMTKTADKHLILLTPGDSVSTHLMKVDTLGNIIWQTDLVRETHVDGYPNSVIETSDSGIVAVTILQVSGYNKISIVKLDMDGNYLWSRQSEQGNSIAGITATENGGFAAVGNGCTWGTFVARFNKNGDIIWKKQYENYSQALTSHVNIIHKNDHSLVISAMSGNTSWDGLDLFSVDSTGNQLWYCNYQLFGNVETIHLIAASDGGYTISGNLSPIDSYDRRQFLFHTDSTGNFLWAKRYTHALQSTPNDILQLNDNSYVLTGYIVYPNSLNSQMLNIRTDQDGNFIWGHSCGNILWQGEGYDMLSCSEWIDGNYFYSAGSGENAVLKKNNGTTGAESCKSDTVVFTAIPITVVQSQPNIGWYWNNTVITADTFSVRNTHFYKSILCSTEVATEEMTGVRNPVISPNPFKFSARIESDQPMNQALIEIFNMQGILVKQMRNVSGQSYIFYRENLPAGLYFIRITEPNKVIRTDKFLIVDWKVED